MPLMVVAATDQTGRTITMLSAALVVVALGLTLLTIWYWRFTSPKRRAAAAAEAAAVPPVVPEEPQPDPEESAYVEPPAIEPIIEPVAATEPPPSDDGPAMGLDSEQWAMLTQAVMDEYLDS